MVYIIEYFIEYFTYILMELNEITRYSVIFLISVTLFTIVLRILLSIAYQSQLTAVRFSKKDRYSRLLKKIMNSYKAAAEKGIANINTQQIVNKYVMKLNFIGWSFESIDKLIFKIETQAPLIGVATLLIPDTDKLWCASTTAIIVLVFWILGSIFDYSSTKSKLIVSLIDYIDNQEGIFYVKDLGSIIISFKNELQSAMLNTDKILSDEIHKMSITLNDSVKYALENISKTLSSSMQTLVDYSAILKEPMNDWKTNIELTSKAQQELNLNTNLLKDSISDFGNLYTQFDKQLENQNKLLTTLMEQVQNEIQQLCNVVNNTDESSKTNAVNNEVLQKQLKYIESNQELLNLTLQKYEVSLEQFTSGMGESIGNIINLYSQNASETINSGIDDLINRISKSNSNLLHNVNESIDKLTKQNIIQQQTILDIKDLVHSN